MAGGRAGERLHGGAGIGDKGNEDKGGWFISFRSNGGIHEHFEIKCRVGRDCPRGEPAS